MNQRHVIGLILLYLKNSISAEDSCTLSDGNLGVCTDIRRCKNVDIGENLKICSYATISLIICCASEFVEPERKSQKFCDEFNLNKNKLIPEPDPLIDESQFPHVALLGYPTENSTEWVCGGTLIASKFILTSAHCLSESYKEIKIARLGYTKLYIQYEAPQDFVIMRSIKHPKYKNNSRYDDIALLELDKEVKYTNYVKPACLHNEKQLGLLAMTSTALVDVGFFTQPDFRLLVFENLVEFKNFSKYSFPNKYLNKGFVEDSQVLAGKYNGRTNQGKSGEGLTSQFKMYGNTYRLIGVKSSIFDLGVIKSDVDVYIRVSHYLDWIESIVWPNQYNDDICTLEDGAPGICLNIRNCQGAKIGSNETKICSYSGNTPIVCCSSTSVVTSSSKRFCNTLKTNSNNDSPTGTRNAFQTEFPHMAALGFILKNNSQQFFCGGTLIAEDIVITAAHCVHNPKLGDVKFVRLGSLKLHSKDAEDINVTVIHIHPEYKFGSIYNDIALLELEKVIEFTDSIKPACLFTEKEIPWWFRMVATGWGRLGYLGNQATHLQVLEGIEEYKNCSEYYPIVSGGFIEKRIDNEEMFCAGRFDGDICPGSSGGPLTSYQDNIYQIIGIISFGKGCGYGAPAVYTRISHYIDWIESIVWPEKK